MDDFKLLLKAILIMGVNIGLIVFFLWLFRKFFLIVPII